MLTNYYTFHGLGIDISSDSEVGAAIHSRLKQFASNNLDCTDLRYEFCSVPDKGSHVVEKPPGRARPVYELSVGELVYFDVEDQLYIDYADRVRVLCDLSQGYARVSFLQSKPDDLWLISHPIFTIPFIEMLKRKARYSLHAAGLCIDNKGLLLAGTSGAGKSTLAVALLRAGFGFLGDDMIFLARGSDGLQVLAFPDEIDVTDETASLFPELHYLLELPALRGWPKRRVRAEEVYPADTVLECRPSVLIFLEIAGAETSVLKPVDPDEAFLDLAPNVLLTEARSSQAHLDVLAELVRGSECYRLMAGRDFDALPLLLRDLMK